MNITLILNSDKNYHLNQYMRFMNLWGNTCVFLPCKRCVVKNVDSGLNGLVQIPAPITNNGLLEKKITETSWASVSSLNGRIRKRVLLRISSEKKNCSRAGVAQWTECRPVNPRVSGSSPSLGHMPRLQARSLVGGAWEAATHWCFSLSPPPFPSL